ncbi:hypothetical protein P24_02106 [Oceanibaculum indicum P24]|uniref:ATPase AAA-type core domain-containing protein n=1 Tax=Oceanibaculum indicum P24 TaxID=1207063 RepID=K2J5I7_9PROT|nr:hypothetical protein P24_02106 [Oceanibaculum indicum P24]
MQFSVSNFLAIKNSQSVSLVASDLSDAKAGLLDYPGREDVKILPSIMIYGANASGKTAIINSINFMKYMVISSYNKKKADEEIGREVFALCNDCLILPSKFSIDFILNKNRYHFSFAVSDKEVIFEELYDYPKNRKRKLYHRSEGKFSFGRNLKGKNKTISEITRKNSLYISAAAQAGHGLLSEIARFFEGIRTVSAVSVRAFDSDELDPRIIEFLKEIGTGVVGYMRVPAEFPEEVKSLEKVIYDAVTKLSTNEVEIKANLLPSNEIRLAHLHESGEEVFFDLVKESSGTRRLLVLLGRIYSVLDKGGVLIIDELDASLHTQIVESIVNLFSNNTINKNNSQLIATTHDTNILKSKFFRRDQLWFVQKAYDGSAHIYPLTDFRTRKGDNLERGYLQGRYGAVPYI